MPCRKYDQFIKNLMYQNCIYFQQFLVHINAKTLLILREDLYTRYKLSNSVLRHNCDVSCKKYFSFKSFSLFYVGFRKPFIESVVNEGVFNLLQVVEDLLLRRKENISKLKRRLVFIVCDVSQPLLTPLRNLIQLSFISRELLSLAYNNM